MKIEFRKHTIKFAYRKESERGIVSTESFFHVGDNNRDQFINALINMNANNSDSIVTDNDIKGVRLGIQYYGDNKIRFYILNYNTPKDSAIIPKGYLESIIKLYDTYSMISYDDEKERGDYKL